MPGTVIMRSIVTALTLSSLLLLTGCDDAKAPQETTRVALQGAYSQTFSADGRDLMVGSLHHGGSLWTTQPLERLYDWNHQDGTYSNITSSAFSPDGRFVVTTDTRTIVLWQRDSGEAVWFWNAPGDIKDIALTSNGDLALLGMADYTATLFDIKNGGIRLRLPHDGIVYSVSVNRDGLIAATGSDDLQVRLWSLSDGQLLHQLPQTNQVRTVEFSADGRLLFTSAMNDSGRIWDVASGRPLAAIGKTRGHYSAARFSADGRQLLTGNSAGRIELWQVSDGTRLHSWRATGEQRLGSRAVLVEDVAFTRDGYLAAGSNGLLYRLQ